MTSIARRPLGLLLLIGVVIHFAGLTYPRQVVFDEATFGKYVAAYCCTGERIFDVHPPHGKVLIAIGAKLGGFKGGFDFDHIGEPYGDQPVLALRFVPALMGAIIPALFYLFLLELRASPRIALLGGLLIALDNAFLSETRIIVFDGILVAATLAALTCFLAAQRHRGAGWRIIAAGALAGMAVGTKTTGLSVVALIGVCLVFGMGVVTVPIRARVKQALVMAVAGFVVYAAGWVAHWYLLTNPGPGDAFYATSGHMVTDLMTAHRTMLEQNVSMTATHPDSSRPWTWPFMKVVPYFWQGEGASIYMVGNPVVWWGTMILLLAILVQLAVVKPLGARMPPPVNTRPLPWIPVVGYAIAFLPLFPVQRVLFMYHYLTPLLFSLAFVLLWLDRQGFGSNTETSSQRVGYTLVIALAVAGFLLISPLTYGFSAGGYDEWLAGVVRSWR